MSVTASHLVESLKPHTPFAEAIVRRQVERAGLRLEALADADLPRLIPLILAAAGPFVDPIVLARLKLLVPLK
jgi:hypothetical protein